MITKDFHRSTLSVQEVSRSGSVSRCHVLQNSHGVDLVCVYSNIYFPYIVNDLLHVASCMHISS